LPEREVGKEAFDTFDIPKQYLWDDIATDVKNLPGKLATGIGEIPKLQRIAGIINRVH
jgi:hypothetical protein